MVYKFALDYYLREGFTYIELGDAEELWENSAFETIYITHTSVYELLRKFHDPCPARTRYIKIWGNHDLDWKEDVGPLRAIFPGIDVYEAALMHSGPGNDILFIHGHQADPICYGWRARLSRWFVRHLWRGVQSIGIGDPTRAAENPGRCNAVDETLSRLARGETTGMDNRITLLHPTIVVAGHTHRPVFEGLSLTERRLLDTGFGPPGIVRKEGPEAIYYNSGSCVHPRCITGIEITAEQNADGHIRPHFALVKWAIQPASTDPPYLSIAHIFLEQQ
jgi:predicted phosphodiesterase